MHTVNAADTICLAGEFFIASVLFFSSSSSESMVVETRVMTTEFDYETGVVANRVLPVQRRDLIKGIRIGRAGGPGLRACGWESIHWSHA
jgi:hypothetical protein